MTVQDLIQKLSEMPPDATVVYSLYSENAAMEDDDVTLYEGWIERHGTYMPFESKHWDYANDGRPNLLMVCHFPGN